MRPKPQEHFQFHERYGFMVGANAYNVLNHANLPIRSQLNAGGALGTIQSTVNRLRRRTGVAAAAVDARIVQVIAKLTF